MTNARSQAYAQLEEFVRKHQDGPLNLPNPGTALVVVDMQRYFLRADSPLARLLETRFSGFTAHMMASLEREVVPNVGKLVHGFRALHLPIFWTALASAKADGSDLNCRLQATNKAAISAGLPAAVPHRDDPWSGFTEALAPVEGETLLYKTTYGTFASTNLEQLLRRRSLNALVVCGVVTNICVEATAREAVDRNFDVTVASNACSAYLPEVQETHLLSFQAPYGEVRTVDAILRALGIGEAAPQPQS